jgi:hypothetical protein
MEPEGLAAVITSADDFGAPVLNSCTCEGLFSETDESSSPRLKEALLSSARLKAVTTRVRMHAQLIAL